jgi:hypothetical protein
MVDEVTVSWSLWQAEPNEESKLRVACMSN